MTDDLELQPPPPSSTSFADPQVSVEHPRVESMVTAGAMIPIRDLLVVHCSEHGDITDWTDHTERHHLQRAAAEHALAEHDGLVDAVGWVR